MKRRIAFSVALLVVGGSLASAAPAQAADAPPWPINCVEEMPRGPQEQSVYFDSEGRLILNPEAAPDDVRAYLGWAPDAALAFYGCVVAPVPTEPANCALGKLLEIVNSVDPVATHARYVYPNPNGPGFAVDYQLLVADAVVLVDCVLFP